MTFLESLRAAREAAGPTPPGWNPGSGPRLTLAALLVNNAEKIADVLTAATAMDNEYTVWHMGNPEMDSDAHLILHSALAALEGGDA